MLREAAVNLSQGTQVAEVCRKFGVTEQTYYREIQTLNSLGIADSTRPRCLS
jgi:transposase-like protein